MHAERSLRVCTSIPIYPPGFSGMGIQIQRSLPFLRSHGIEVTVLTRRMPETDAVVRGSSGEAIDRLLAEGSSRAATLRRMLQFRRYFAQRRGAFDVLHSNMYDWEFLWNVRFLKSIGLPVVLEMVLLNGDDPLKISRERLGRFKLWLLHQVDIWIGISGAFRPRLRAAGIPDDRFRLVYPGVDVAAYRPRSEQERRSVRALLRLPGDARIAVSAGSVIRRKGFDRLLRAWGRFGPVRGRDLLLLVGPASLAEGLGRGDLPFLEEIRSATSAPGLEGTVQIVGRADNVHDYFAAADLFLLLSRQEGLPIVVVEALASGLPCVVSPLDGIDEIVLEGETGHIVPDPDEPGSVASRITQLLDRPQARGILGDNARRLALRRFSFEARARTLKAIYRDVAGRAPRDGAVS